MMRIVVFSFLLIVPIFSQAQVVAKYSQLAFENGKAFKVIKDKSGFVKSMHAVTGLVKRDGGYYNYKNGLPHGDAKVDNAKLTFENGILETFVYKVENVEVVRLSNLEHSMPITNIKFGLHIENQVNNVWFYDDDSFPIGDSTKFSVGLVISYKYGATSFMELDNIVLESFTISLIRRGFICEERSKNQYMNNGILNAACCGSWVYVQDIYLRWNNTRFKLPTYKVITKKRKKTSKRIL